MLYQNTLQNDLLVDLSTEAWEKLKSAIVYYRDRPIGTVAAVDPHMEALNYDQCFVRDFVPSALLFLIRGEPRSSVTFSKKL